MTAREPAWRGLAARHPAWRGLADRLGLAVGYPLALFAGWLVLRAQPPATRQHWLDWASTNLANAPDHPISALVVSAFVSDGDPTGWVALGAIGLAATGWVMGAWRTAVLVSTAHVIGTLVSEGILAYRISIGAAPAADRHVLDIGASYVVVCALAAGIAYSTWPGRLASAVGFAIVSPDLFGGLPYWDVSAIGHVCSIAIAVGLGWPFARAYRRRRERRAEVDLLA